MSENTLNNRMCFKFIEIIQLFDEFKKDQRTKYKNDAFWTLK